MGDYKAAEASMGNSEYRMEEYATPGMLRVSRFNPSDRREVVFFIPQKLVFRYVAEKLLHDSILTLLGRLT